MPKKKQTDIEQLEFAFPEEEKEYPLEQSELYRKISEGKDTMWIPQYCRKNGLLFHGDSIEWMQQLPKESVDMIFADPPYNIKKAEWDKFESQEQYIEWSIQWIREAERVLKPSGTLFICGFTEILADLKHPAMKYFKSCKWLIWHYKNKANLGTDWGALA